MIKHGVFLALFAASLALMSCDLAIPKAVEVRAAPDIDVKAAIDLGKTIKKELRSALQGKINAPGVESEPKMAFTENKTDGNMVLVARMEVISVKKSDLITGVNSVKVNGTQTLQQLLQNAGQTAVSSINIQSILDSPNTAIQGVLNQTFTTLEELPGAVPPIPEITLPSGSMGDILEGFKFTKSSGELYINDNAAGSNFSNYLSYKYGVNLSAGEALTTGVMKPMYSGYEKYWDNDDEPFPAYKHEGHGQVIGELFKGNALRAEISVSVNNGTSIRQLLDCLNTADIKAELIAWIPLVFEAEKNDAFFKIPIDSILGGEEGDKDLFMREKDKKPVLIVEYMSVEIDFSVDAFNKMFNGRKLQIINTNEGSKFDKKYDLINNNIAINFTEAYMLEINYFPENNPFIPSIRVLFDQGKELLIPWELKTANVKLKAKAVARVDW